MMIYSNDKRLRTCKVIIWNASNIFLKYIPRLDGPGYSLHTITSGILGEQCKRIKVRKRLDLKKKKQRKINVSFCAGKKKSYLIQKHLVEFESNLLFPPWDAAATVGYGELPTKVRGPRTPWFALTTLWPWINDFSISSTDINFVYIYSPFD